MNVFRITTVVALATLTCLWTGCSEQEEVVQTNSPLPQTKALTEATDARFAETEPTDIDAVYALGQYAQALSEDFSFEGEETMPVKTTLSDERREQMIELLHQVEGADEEVVEMLETIESIEVVRLSKVYVPHLEAELDIYYIPIPDRYPVIIPLCWYWGCFPYPWPWWCRYAICFPWFDRDDFYLDLDNLNIDDAVYNLDKLGMPVDPKHFYEPTPVRELPEGAIHLNQ